MNSEDRFTIFLRAVAGLLLIGFAIAYAARRDWPPFGFFGLLGLAWWWGAYRQYRKATQPTPPRDEEANGKVGRP